MSAVLDIFLLQIMDTQERLLDSSTFSLGTKKVLIGFAPIASPVLPFNPSP